MVGGTSFGTGQIWTSIQLQFYVTLDKLLGLSEVQFPQLLKKNNAFFVGMLYIKHLVQCLAYRKHPINGSCCYSVYTRAIPFSACSLVCFSR